MDIRDDIKVELIQNVGDDGVIVKAARVSTGTDGLAPFHPDTQAADSGLVNFLMKNRHGSPFEHGSMTFRVEAPIAVSREHFRHRAGWSYNEESGRYKMLDPVFYVPPPGRPLVQTGKAGAYTFEMGTVEMHEKMVRRMRIIYKLCWTTYVALMALGVAKEVARLVLPVGLFTSYYATCNPRSLMHFLSLRTHDPDAFYESFPMYEIEKVAVEMERHFKALYPVTYDAWVKNGRVAP